MAPKYKYELDDKVWIIPTQEIGIIEDIKGHKYHVYVRREQTVEFGGYTWEQVDEGHIICMAHELLPYTEGMELLYE